MKYFHRDEDVPKKEIERRKKVSKAVKSKWQDPEFRKMMIEKQRKLGLR